MPTDQVRAYQSGAPDAYGNAPERATSTGTGNPCRHCLRNIPEGAAMLILAHRPFDAVQPYAETGPIFLCAAPCERHQDTGALPEVLTTAPDYLIKGYGADDRIVYGTGTITSSQTLLDTASDIFARPEIAYVHIRSSSNNCYQARLDRDA
ncbi:DUF1203 domain-containing protein [Ruegeria sp. 2012CJ41-6]|uniref:DUF1203 domain-containing protein n=1 Tax=Ruegeria spongiae TaxID=2942209 RepID=A0ABT0PYP9_9RHOB|nr:DUF1203 domain-containing protein [Ruegeria spongiae]MCL6282744.1 DUF1203 domain-containing protein [Ruegeria spongiae]